MTRKPWNMRGRPTGTLTSTRVRSMISETDTVEALAHGQRVSALDARIKGDASPTQFPIAAVASVDRGKSRTSQWFVRLACTRSGCRG
jgi:hypothetical protein